MLANRAKKLLVTSFIAGALTAAAAVTAPPALASPGCHQNDHQGGGTHQTDPQARHGSDNQHIFFPNGLLPLGCIPGSMTRPCDRAH